MQIKQIFDLNKWLKQKQITNKVKTFYVQFRNIYCDETN